MVAQTVFGGGEATLWARVLLEPYSVQGAWPPPDGQLALAQAVALLLQPRVVTFDYDSHEQMPQIRGQGDDLLYRGTLLLIQRDPQAGTVLQGVARAHQSRTIAGVGAVLAARPLHEGGRAAEADRLLDLVAESEDESASELDALIALQAAVLAYERADRFSAAGHAESARARASRNPGPLSSVVQVITDELMDLLDEGIPSLSDARLRLPALQWRSGVERQALATALLVHVRSQALDPSIPDAHVEATDRADDMLSSALVHAEVLGDYHQIRRLSGMVASHRLSVEVDDDDPETPQKRLFSGFVLLARSTSTVAAESASAVYRRGPLEPLTSTMSWFARVGWRFDDERSVLQLIREAGDLTPADDARRLVARIIARIAVDDGGSRGYWPPYEAARALDGPLYAAPDSAHEHAADAILLALRRRPDQLLRTALSRLFRAMRWRVVPSPTRTDWQEWSRDTLATPSADREAGPELAIDCLRSQANEGDQDATSILLDYFMQTSHSHAAASLLSLGVSLPSEATRRLVSACVQSLAGSDAPREAPDRRVDLSRSDVPALLLALMLDGGAVSDEGPWEQLAVFLSDPASDAFAKLQCVDLMVERWEQLPVALTSRVGAIREAMEGGDRAGFPWVQDERIRRDVLLRFEIKAGLLPGRARMTLLAAARGSAEERVRAAYAMAAASTVLDVGDLLDLGSWIASDERAEVRAAGGWGLARVARAGDATVTTLLATLLDDPGALCPHAVLTGLQGSPLLRDAGMLHVIERVRDSHASARARRLASTLAADAEGSPDGE